MAGTRLHGGLSPSASRDSVIRELGETVEASGPNLTVLAYQCRDFAPLGSDVMMAIRIIGGEVESISIVNDEKD